MSLYGIGFPYSKTEVEIKTRRVGKVEAIMIKLPNGNFINRNELVKVEVEQGRKGFFFGPLTGEFSVKFSFFNEENNFTCQGLTKKEIDELSKKLENTENT